MQLTQLEVKGFKSFGDKITINFDEGITSIVGPNGCGKSNVVDAIRWVLGEQSTKTLRSEKMENIIFNGTNTRKQAQLAEVSLSFNNNKNILPTEFSQVTITRKLYRNGDSEYRLNDVQCRLKDITDLFMDTGIGSDSYAIIELKMVEEIISNKEHSRRNLFEEASGISKYKTRKKQTINRLTDTENDLSRVEDLLYEIEKNLKSLENQARKTERYYALKEQYKVWSLTLTSLRIAETQRSLKAIQVQHLNEEHQNSSLNAAIAQAEVSIQQLKEESLIKEQHVALQQKKLNQQLSEIRGFEMEKTIKNEQLNNFQKREGQLNQEIVHDKQQIQQVQNQLKRLQEDSLEARSLLTGMETVLATQLQEIAALKREQVQEKEQLDALRNTKNDRQKKSYELEKQITILTIQGDALREESRRSRSDEQNKADELAGFNERLEGISEQTEALEDRLFSAQENEQANLHAIAEMEKALERLNEKSQQNARLLDAKKNEFNLTKSMVDNLEGFPESIRFLKKSPQWNKNIPLFSDILLCQEKYRAAVENLLEPYMNYYVVESFHEAYEAINLLSDARKGKAGFFVLENLPAVLEKTTAPAHLIPALSVIEVEKKYALLCSHLLHSVYIQTHSQADGLPSGNLILLEPNGKYIRKNFSLSGGAVGLFDGKKIGRTRNLDQLANEIKNLTAVQQEIESEEDRTSHAFTQLKRHTQKALIEELQGQINRLKNDHISIETRREQYEVFIQNNLEQKNTIETKITTFEQALKQANPELLLLQQERTLAEEALLKKQEDFTLLAEELSEKNTEYNQTNIQFHQQNNKVLGIEKDIEYREIQVEDNEKQVAQKEKEYQEIQRGIQEILQHVDLSQDDLLALYTEKEALENALQEVEQGYFTARGTTTTLEQEVQRLRKNKEISNTLIQEYKDQINRYHLELNAIKERLSVEFSFDMDELQDPQEIDENENELSERIKKIKKQLDDFGAINPMAMQAYQEMNDRYRFIIEEKNDLTDARATLLKTIQEIDLNAKEKFMEAFLKVRENFKMVFRSLFNDGDTCDLIISDPENPLESNIEIIARPKGKRPLSINQLSGGEKTLTSTALLFSLYLLKPAPFCIFDEIDAPLDDTNIDKFNNIIREFSNNSQFIIVSHNKRTIASTDIIYGVTMVEAGISRVVPVDMRASFGSIVDVN